MKFYISNTELDAQITEIKRKIRLSMNGIVSDKMKENGIIYKKNFGVSIPRIKEIAQSYPSNHDLAQRLWMLQIRETMIMATLLEPADKFSIENAREWVKCFNQIEICEQSCMNLFCKVDYANSLALEWMQSGEIWAQITGFMLAARVYGKFNEADLSTIVGIVTAQSDTDNLHLYKSMALCLSRMCRKDKETATYILKQTEAFSGSSLIGQRYIFNEVKQEILFLDIL